MGTLMSRSHAPGSGARPRLRALASKLGVARHERVQRPQGPSYAPQVDHAVLGSRRWTSDGGRRMLESVLAIIGMLDDGPAMSGASARTADSRAEDRSGLRPRARG